MILSNYINGNIDVRRYVKKSNQVLPGKKSPMIIKLKWKKKMKGISEIILYMYIHTYIYLNLFRVAPAACGRC